MLRALGEPTRLSVFNALLECARPLAFEEDGGVRTVSGSTVSEVCCRIGAGERPTSRMSFHLKELRNAGLVETEKSGRHVVCRVCPDAVAALRAFFERSAQCCSGEARP